MKIRLPLDIRSLVAPALMTLIPTSLILTAAACPAAALQVEAVPPAFASAARSACGTCALESFERRQITEDVAHYSAVLQVGPGTHDRIGLHRVTRERAPYRPVRTREAVLLAHGINVGFRGTFLANVGVEGTPPNQNLPVFLAERGVDVWGIDFRWALVPGDVQDVSFMADWGLERDAADLRIALEAARWGRWLSGSGRGKIDLVGYSRGGRISYTYLNDESQRPPRRRHVDRFVQLDANFKAGSEETRQLACSSIDAVQQEIDSGNTADAIGFLASLGELAQADPEGASPIFPGLTNRQAALVVGTTPPGGEGTFHLFAGTFANGLPTGLRFTAEPVALSLLSSAANFQPLAGWRDALIVLCDEGGTGLDDHLADITVPVFYLGAAGGNRDGGTATFPFLGSRELQSLVVSLDEPESELVDVGHGDILAMPGAASLVWQPILDWITAGR